jgi:membrane-bound lytic murein transglycosylase D
MKSGARIVLAIFIILFLGEIVIWLLVNRQKEEVKEVKAGQVALKEECQRLKEEVKEIKEKPIYSFPWVTEGITLCGEKVPLERDYVKERLKEALIIEANRNSSIELIFLRSGRWFSFIESELRKIGMSIDLRYVPIVESDLNYEANSNKGARGMWQLTKYIARKYGLQVDYYIDERYDPFKSTKAAIRHLKDLYLGSENWSEALAGYNMGEDALGKAIEKEGATDFYEVRGIPTETQKFVFRILAIKLIMENPEKYGYPGIESINKIKYQTWQVKEIELTIEKKQATIQEIVEKLKSRYPRLTYREFRTYNRHVLNDYLPKGKYDIYVYLEKQNGTS